MPSKKYTKAGVKKTNIADVVGRANEWMKKQGARDGPAYCSSAGRKALASWLSELEICYKLGFEIHADCYTTWKKSYQPDCQNPTRFGERRTQSKKFDDVLAAYKKLRHKCGIARNKHKLEAKDRLAFMNLKKMGMTRDEIQKVLDGDDGWEDL